MHISVYALVFGFCELINFEPFDFLMDLFSFWG